MSTRCNVILKEGEDKLFFYRHSDGYPKCVLPSLAKLTEWIKSGKVRNNLSQGAGWLIVLGVAEYQTLPASLFPSNDKADAALEAFSPSNWKVGAYEPTTGIHGDIEYMYEIDMSTGEVTHKEV